MFYLKILIGHPWNQGWSGFSSAKATSEVAQEVGQGERESDNLKERINISSKYWMEMKYSPLTQAIWALGRRLQWKRRESKMQGQQLDPPKILTPCNMFSPGFEGWKRHLGCWKPVLVLLCSALKDPGGLTLVVDVVPPPDLQFAHKFSLGFWQKTWVQQECDRSRSWRSRSRAREGGWWGRNFRWNCRRTNRREGKLDEGRTY